MTDPNEARCAGCGWSLPEGAMFCGECGRSVAARTDLPAPDAAASASPVSGEHSGASATPLEHCDQCGAAISPGDIFCGECGHVAGSITRAYLAVRDTAVIDPIPRPGGEPDSTRATPGARPVPRFVAESGTPADVRSRLSERMRQPPLPLPEPALPEPAVSGPAVVESAGSERAASESDGAEAPAVESAAAESAAAESAAAEPTSPEPIALAPTYFSPPGARRGSPGDSTERSVPRHASRRPVDDDSDAADLEATRIVSSANRGARYVLQFSTGESVTVSGTGLIGRNPVAEPTEEFDATVRLFDPTRSVSKTHLEFGQDGGRFWIRDRYSGNGTVVRGPDSPPVRCEPGRRYPVARGSRIDIGEQFFVVS